MNFKWDRRFILLARHVAQWSKDPSTQVGAVIVDQKRRVVSLGYNGFPRGVNDDPLRYHLKGQKYPCVVHAEPNAILTANRDLVDTCIYIYPLPPCCECAKLIIQSGIIRVCYVSRPKKVSEHPQFNFNVASEMFSEAGVHVEKLGPF